LGFLELCLKRRHVVGKGKPIEVLTYFGDSPTMSKQCPSREVFPGPKTAPATEVKTVSEMSLTGPQQAPASKPVRRRHRAVKPQLLSRTRIDRRSNAARVFDRLVADVESDLGGRDQLSAVERALIEGFAGAAVVLDNLNTRLLLGQEIDLSQHAQAVSAMVRVASRLGLQRRARPVETLAEYLAREYPHQPEQEPEQVAHE
jgi:hypothetical protein